MEKQALKIMTLSFHLVDLRNFYAIQICHIAEHSHPALLESLLQRVAPCVQSEVQSDNWYYWVKFSLHM
jgi:hypothetical protein